MTPVSAAKFREVHKAICVLYEAQGGKIRHFHLTVVLQDGHHPSESEIESIARTSLEKRGKRHDHLKALHVAVDAIKPFGKYRVDTAKSALVELSKRVE